MSTVRPRPVVEPDGDGWTIALPGTPIAADGATLEAAVEEMVDALRDYAKAWRDRLRHAPNHAGHEDLVRFVETAADPALRTWLARAALDSAADRVSERGMLLTLDETCERLGVDPDLVRRRAAHRRRG